MADWIRFGAEVMKSMIVEKNPITLASFARRVEKGAVDAKLRSGEMTVRWVWQALLAHPVLSEELRHHFAKALDDKGEELTVLPEKSLLAVELTPASGRLRARLKNVVDLPMTQWALVELLEPLKFIRGNRGRLRCEESSCRVALQPRPKPPPVDAKDDVLRAWALRSEAITVLDCDSLNHAAQEASLRVEHLRRSHTINIFSMAVWLPDDESAVYLEDLRDRVEYDGHSSTDAYIKASRTDIRFEGIDTLLRALNRPRPITTLRELLALPSAQVAEGMRVRSGSNVEGEVLTRHPDGRLRVRLLAQDGSGHEGEMDVWMFDEVRRGDGGWGMILLNERELERRRMFDLASRRR